MEQPEPESRNCIVVAWIAQVQEAKHLFVNEIKPEEAVVLTGPAMEGEGKVGRITERRQNVPGCGDQDNDEESADGPEPLPGSKREELFGQE